MKIITHTAARNQIKLHSSKSLVTIPVDKIVRLEGSSNYTVFYTKKGKYISSRTLKHYQGILDEKWFIRVHKSHIVNLRHIKSIDESISEIVFDDGDNIEVSRRKLKDFVEKFEIYNKA
jgi:two-component system LytT family response regulator